MDMSEMLANENEIFYRVSGPQAQAGGCPTTNCVGMTAFLVVAAVQLSLMLAYTLYK